MSEFLAAFGSRGSLLEFERFSYFVVFLPQDVAKELPLQELPRLRVRGELDDHPFHGAWMPSRRGWYPKLSQDLVKKGGYHEGSWVQVWFRIAGQDEVDLPEALDVGLRAERWVRLAWERLSPGKQRGLASRVALGKSAGTASKRAEAVIAELLGEDAEAPWKRRPSR